jgi:hypothetical protein
MLEAPHYKPKVWMKFLSSSNLVGSGSDWPFQLYFTSNGPMPEKAGEEEPFPAPDNQSKMKRSCENAEHVGKCSIIGR